MIRFWKSRAFSARVSLALLAWAVVAVPTNAGAQSQLPRWSADRILTEVERDAGLLQLGYVQAVRVLTQPDSFPATTRDSVLNGLERLALTAPNRAVRRAAASTIAVAGRSGPRRPFSGAAHRLTRIYSETDDAGVQGVIRGRAPQLADKTGAARLLRMILITADAAEARNGRPIVDEPAPVVETIASLARLGPEGRAVLMELHREGRLRSTYARVRLDDLARRNFDVEPQP